MAVLTKEIKEKIKEVSKHYPMAESAILPALHLVQQEFNYIDSKLIEEIALELSLPPEFVYSTATFYTMFNFKSLGRYHLQICRNLSCSLLGSGSLVDYIGKKLGIAIDQTTGDGKFTLSTVECLGACGGAPVMMINNKYYENLTATKVDEILKECE